MINYLNLAKASPKKAFQLSALFLEVLILRMIVQ